MTAASGGGAGIGGAGISVGGTSGSAGISGTVGSGGATAGATGNGGATGTAGSAGATGRAGAAGNAGATGSAGAIGAAGTTGSAGSGGSPGPKAAAIGCADKHDCAILTDGTVHCWGTDAAGELGDGTPLAGFRSTPVKVAGLPSGATAVAGGTAHTCAIVSNGDVWCWGENVSGQLGDGDQYLAATPVKVVNLAAKAQAIAAAYKTTCAQLADGSVACWGSEDWGLFGTGSNTLAVSPTPISVPLPGAASGIAVTLDHACTSVSSVLTCWGSNNEGEIGTGTATSGLLQATGSIVQDGFGVGSDFTCALIGGAVKCWGSDNDGQSGNGTTSTAPVPTPTPVPSLSGVVSLGVGFLDVCAVTAAGKVFCWGFNSDGEVGNGTTTTGIPSAVSTPVQVSTLSTASAVCGGNAHSCALLADGTVWCWGTNFGTSPVQIAGW